MCIRDRSVKMPWHGFGMGVACSNWSAPGCANLFISVHHSWAKSSFNFRSECHIIIYNFILFIFWTIPLLAILVFMAARLQGPLWCLLVESHTNSEYLGFVQPDTQGLLINEHFPFESKLCVLVTAPSSTGNDDVRNDHNRQLSEEIPDFREL